MSLCGIWDLSVAMYLAIVGNIRIITAWDFRFAINHAADLYGSSQNSTATL